jgi:hypothetical protein
MKKLFIFLMILVSFLFISCADNDSNSSKPEKPKSTITRVELSGHDVIIFK